MSAPITEAHRKLRETLEIRWMRATELEIEQLIADSEAAAVEAADFALQQERNIHMTTIAERDQLRAEVELGEQLQAATEASLKTVTGERDQLRAEVERLGRATTNGQLNWMQESDRQNARAERAEAEIKDRAAMMRDVMRERDAAEAQLAAERARLRDLWCEMALEYRDERISYVSVQITRSVWDELDAAMKEGAK